MAQIFNPLKKAEKIKAIAGALKIDAECTKKVEDFDAKTRAIDYDRLGTIIEQSIIDALVAFELYKNQAQMK